MPAHVVLSAEAKVKLLPTWFWGFFFAKIKGDIITVAIKVSVNAEMFIIYTAQRECIGNLPYVAPAEQTFLSPKELKYIIEFDQCRKKIISEKQKGVCEFFMARKLHGTEIIPV